jgi:hypothetical protein
MELSENFRTPRAAAYVGLSASSLEKLRVSGGGPAYCRPGGKVVIYRKSDLDSWLESSRTTSTSEAAASAASTGRGR